MPAAPAVARIEAILAEAGVADEGLAERLAEAATEGLATRRQMIARCEAAFREGFLTGKRWPKFAPYAADVWRKSQLYTRHFARRTAAPEAESRYARYNDL